MTPAEESRGTVVCIQGPTASGKSELADRLAAELDGEVVSADSMQVYRGMDIGTAKVAPDVRRVPYHCVDMLDPGQPYSAALFQKDARAAFTDIEARGKVPVLCGGTGFYVRAALDELDFAPGAEAGSPLREEYSRLADELGGDELHALLVKRDPESAALIHPHDVKRVARALEMNARGESYAARKHAFRKVPAHVPSVRIALDMDRDMLYERIDRRVGEMFQAGLVDEVKGLLERGFRDAVTAREAIGYKEVVRALEGECSMAEAEDDVKRATRRYAKRQLTWLRSQPGLHWLDVGTSTVDDIVARALRIVRAGI